MLFCLLYHTHFRKRNLQSCFISPFFKKAVFAQAVAWKKLIQEGIIKYNFETDRRKVWIDDTEYNTLACNIDIKRHPLLK